jgi:hypothetical protein
MDLIPGLLNLREPRTGSFADPNSHEHGLQSGIPRVALIAGMNLSNGNPQATWIREFESGTRSEHFNAARCFIVSMNERIRQRLTQRLLLCRIIMTAQIFIKPEGDGEPVTKATHHPSMKLEQIAGPRPIRG